MFRQNVSSSVENTPVNSWKSLNLIPWFNQTEKHLRIITNHLIIKSSVRKYVSHICDDNIKIPAKFSFSSRLSLVAVLWWMYGCVIYIIIYVNFTLLMNATHARRVCASGWLIFLFLHICSACLNSFSIWSRKLHTHWVFAVRFIECNFYDSIKS